MDLGRPPSILHLASLARDANLPVHLPIRLQSKSVVRVPTGMTVRRDSTSIRTDLVNHRRFLLFLTALTSKLLRRMVAT